MVKREQNKKQPCRYCRDGTYIHRNAEEKKRCLNQNALKIRKNETEVRISLYQYPTHFRKDFHTFLTYKGSGHYGKEIFYPEAVKFVPWSDGVFFIYCQQDAFLKKNHLFPKIFNEPGFRKTNKFLDDGEGIKFDQQTLIQKKRFLKFQSSKQSLTKSADEWIPYLQQNTPKQQDDRIKFILKKYYKDTNFLDDIWLIVPEIKTSQARKLFIQHLTPQTIPLYPHQFVMFQIQLSIVDMKKQNREYNYTKLRNGTILSKTPIDTRQIYKLRTKFQTKPKRIYKKSGRYSANFIQKRRDSYAQNQSNRRLCQYTIYKQPQFLDQHNHLKTNIKRSCQRVLFHGLLYFPHIQIFYSQDILKHFNRLVQNKKMVQQNQISISSMKDQSDTIADQIEEIHISLESQWKFECPKKHIQPDVQFMIKHLAYRSDTEKLKIIQLYQKRPSWTIKYLESLSKSPYYFNLQYSLYKQHLATKNYANLQRCFKKLNVMRQITIDYGFEDAQKIIQHVTESQQQKQSSNQVRLRLKCLIQGKPYIYNPQEKPQKEKQTLNQIQVHHDWQNDDNMSGKKSAKSTQCSQSLEIQNVTQQRVLQQFKVEYQDVFETPQWTSHYDQMRKHLKQKRDQQFETQYFKVWLKFQKLRKNAKKCLMARDSKLKYKSSSAIRNIQFFDDDIRFQEYDQLKSKLQYYEWYQKMFLTPKPLVKVSIDQIIFPSQRQIQRFNEKYPITQQNFVKMQICRQKISLYLRKLNNIQGKIIAQETQLQQEMKCKMRQLKENFDRKKQNIVKLLKINM